MNKVPILLLIVLIACALEIVYIVGKRETATEVASKQGPPVLVLSNSEVRVYTFYNSFAGSWATYAVPVRP